LPFWLNQVQSWFFTNPSIKKPKVEGQHLTKVDRETDVVAPKKLDPQVRELIKDEIRKQGDRTLIAGRANMTLGKLNQLLDPKATAPNLSLLPSLQKALGVVLTGSHIGEMTKKAKANAKMEAESEKGKKEKK
jgi:hypothetical protein